ncbi:hypothetical protein FOL46_008302 [Perkinsus olseni]|uniref:PDZ domain-containing protein n=1 Tax=Perkinsus olseni TaxID=32597 RepID=A0A7J6L7Z4_PEROL|nr:hypothetical protein FOL46_008302 [Perkinsus olseni]
MAQDSRPATAVSLPRLAKVSSSSKQEGTAAAALTVSEDDDGPQPVKVLIEYCQRCYRHPWCVNHSEERYFSQFMDIAGRISEAFPEVDEIVAVKDPRIGALEVTVVHGQHQQVVFSKLQSDRWPNVAKILERIRRVARRMMSPDPRNTLLIENEFLTPRHHTVEVSLAAETPVPFALGLEITDRPPFLVTVAQEGKYGAECGVARGDVLHCINGKACDRMDLEGLLVELRKRPMRLYCRRFDRTKRRRRAGGAMSFTRLFGRRPASMRAEKATTDHYQRQRKGMTTIDTIPPRPPPSRRLPKPAYQVKRTDRSGEMMGPRLGPVPHPRSAPDQVRNARSKTMEGQRPSGGRRTQPGSEMLLQGERGGPSRHSVKRIGARAASSSLSQKKDLTDTAGDTEESRIEETRPEALAANGTGLAATGGIVQAEEAAPGPVEGAKEASSIDESTGVPKLPVVTDNGSAENYYDEDFESDNETWEDEDLPASEQAARATTSSPSVPPVTTKVLEPQLGSNSAPLETQERTEIANADSSVAEAPQESTTVAGHAMATAADMGEPAQSVASSPGPNGGLESLVTGVESIDGDGEEGTPPQEAVVATAANTEEVPERTAGVATEAQVECTEDSSGAEEGTEPHNAGEGPEVDITARDVGQAPASSTGTDHEQGPDAPESVDADVDSRVVLGDDSESTELTAGREADSSANAIATEGIAEAGTPLPETCADGGNGEVAGPGGSETSHAAVDAAEVEGPQAATPALQSEVPEIDDGLEVAGGATQPEAMQPGVEEAPDEVGHDTLSDGAREMISSVVGMVVRQASDRISPTVETAPVVEDPPQAGGSEQAEETKDGYDDDFEEYLPSDEEVPEEPKANAMAREEEVWGGAGDTPRPGNEFESKDQGHDKHRSIDEPNPTSPRKPFRGEHANEAAPLTGVADFPTAEATEERPKASDGESDYDDDFESD